MFGTRRNRSNLLLTALVALAVSAPTALRAQQSSSAAFPGDGSRSSVLSASDSLGSVDRDSLRGPRASPVGIATHASVDAVERTPQQDRGTVSVGSNAALMGVGIAAIAVGLIIGGDSGTVIAVGGGLVGLLGLYRFLQ